MRRRSQARDSFAAVRYAVDTGAMPPPRRRSFLARQKRVVLPVVAVTLLGAAFLAKEVRRAPAEIPAAAIDCTSARDVWRPACRPENVQSWVAKASRRLALPTTAARSAVTSIWASGNVRVSARR